jgi:hypothetical protein
MVDGMTDRPDTREALPTLAEELRRRIDLVAMIGNTVHGVKRRGRNASARCPFHNEKSPSFQIYGGADAHYHCFGCGAHGDAITFRMQFHNLDFKPALGELADEYGLRDRFEAITGEKVQKRERPAPLKRPIATGDREREASRREDFMLDLVRLWWRQGVPAAGTLVETYLRHRIPGYGVPPVSLRFCAAVPESFDPKDPLNKVTWPAMLAGVQVAAGPQAGKVRGLHITYLARDGRGKAQIETTKRMLGQCWGGAVRLTPIVPDMPFIVGEGIETTETVRMRRLKKRGPDSATFWAALSWGNLAGAGDPDKQASAPFHPTKRRKDPQTKEETGPRIRLPTIYPDFSRPGIIVPTDCSEAILLCDGDSDPWNTRAMMRRATRRIQKQGKPVRQVWADRGHDFNSMVQAGRAEDAFGLPAIPDQSSAVA